jgi:hypothetical protein
MKRSLLHLLTLVLFVSLLPLGLQGDDGDEHHRGDHHKHRYSTPEPDVLAMLGLSLSTIAGGLVIRHRRMT